MYTQLAEPLSITSGMEAVGLESHKGPLSLAKVMINLC